MKGVTNSLCRGTGARGEDPLIDICQVHICGPGRCPWVSPLVGFMEVLLVYTKEAFNLLQCAFPQGEFTVEKGVCGFEGVEIVNLRLMGVR